MTGETLVNTSLNFTNSLELGNLSGYKLDPSNTGLPGWIINVYYQNGTLFGTNTTDSSGYFRFDPVPFGNYTVTETQQDGYMQLAPPGGFWTVNMTGETLVNTSLNFTNSLELGNLSGYKLDPSNTGLPGWIINVYYQNGTLFGTNTTDTSGYLRFDPVPFGNYTVTEVLQNGYTQLAPPGGFWTVNMTDSTLVNTSLNFTNQLLTGNLSGYKLDPANNGLSDWTINVYYENGTLFGSEITAGDGSYKFDPVPFGNYTVAETLKNGYTQIAPPGGFWTVNMTDSTLVNTSLNFTNQLLFGNISGYKLDLDEDGLSGWNISVYYENGTLFGSQDTVGDGSYRFDPMPFGNYTVYETLQDGWMQIAPQDGYWPVNMTDATLVFNGLNFTNEEIAPFGNISGYKLDTLDHGLSGWNISVYCRTELCSRARIRWEMVRISSIPCR